MKFIQQDPKSALSIEIHGVTWSIEAQLLAEAVDALNQANWQRAGRQTAPRPKRVPRPWEETKATSIGSDPIPISQFDDWWDSKRKKA